MLERKMIQETGSVRVPVVVGVSQEAITWTCMENGIVHTYELRYKQILSAPVTSLADQARLSLHYVKVVVGNDSSVVLRHVTISFIASDAICNEVSQCVDEHLKRTQHHRPKRLLIFINPISGSRDSVTLYANVVKHLFDIADVTAHDIVTKNEVHARDVLSDYNMADIDAVVSMGGDGSYGQVFNGLIQKAMKDAGEDMNDVSVEPITPRVGFGVLPTGSGCAVARVANSSVDLETSVLTIILGHTSLGDVSVFRQNNGAFLRYSLFIGASGTFTNAFQLLERARCLGKARYLLMVPSAWWMFRLYDVEIEYKEVPEEQREFRYVDPPNPSADNPTCSTVDGPKPGWKTFRGKIPSWFFIHSYLVKYFKWMRINPYAKPVTSSGMYRILLDKAPSFWSLMKMYLTFSNVKDVQGDGRDCLPREVMEQINATEVRVRVVDSEKHGEMCSLRTEGESLRVSECSAKLFPKKFKFFVINDDLVREVLDYHTDKSS